MSTIGISKQANTIGVRAINIEICNGVAYVCGLEGSLVAVSNRVPSIFVMSLVACITKVDLACLDKGMSGIDIVLLTIDMPGQIAKVGISVYIESSLFIVLLVQSHSVVVYVKHFALTVLDTHLATDAETYLGETRVCGGGDVVLDVE